MKKVFTGFIIFLVFMAACTLISRSVYAYRLPMVGTLLPEAKYVEHKLEAEGTVVAGGEAGDLQAGVPDFLLFGERG